MSDPVGPQRQVQRAATPCNKRKITSIEAFLTRNQDRGLSEPQRTAVTLLLHGAGDAAAAEQLGVDRTTVFRWRTQHAGFRAELERQRERAFQDSIDRLRSMVGPALDVVQRQMGDATDPRAALRAAALLLRLAAPRRSTTGAASPRAGAASPRPAPSDTWDWIEAYVNAPLPGQPGAPEDLARALNAAADDDDDDDNDGGDVDEEPEDDLPASPSRQ